MDPSDAPGHVRAFDDEVVLVALPFDLDSSECERSEPHLYE